MIAEELPVWVDHPDEPPAPQQKGRHWRLGAMAVGLTGPLVGLLAYLGVPVAVPVAVHVVGALGAHFLWRAPGVEGRVLAVQARTLVICFPVVGSLAAWLIYGREGKLGVKVLDDYKKYIAYERDRPRYMSLVGDEEAHLGLELAVLPLRDQLESGDLAAKQGAASRLLEFEGGDRILREALAHPEDETRLFASLALVRRQEAMFGRLRAARVGVHEFPNEPQEQLELALAAQSYALGCGAGERVAESFWNEAARAARAVLERGGLPEQQAAAHMVLVEERLTKDDVASALTHAEAAVRHAPEHAEAGLKRMELLFRLGRIDELKAAARAVALVAEVGTDAGDAAAFWTGAGHGG